MAVHMELHDELVLSGLVVATASAVGTILNAWVSYKRYTDEYSARPDISIETVASQQSLPSAEAEAEKVLTDLARSRLILRNASTRALWLSIAVGVGVAVLVFNYAEPRDGDIGGLAVVVGIMACAVTLVVTVFVLRAALRLFLRIGRRIDHLSRDQLKDISVLLLRDKGPISAEKFEALLKEQLSKLL